jgi:hypothetical protein
MEGRTRLSTRAVHLGGGGDGLHDPDRRPEREPDRRRRRLDLYALIALALLAPLEAAAQLLEIPASITIFDDSDTLQEKFDAGSLGGGDLDCATTPGSCVLLNPTTDGLCIGDDQGQSSTCAIYLDSSGSITLNVPGAGLPTTPSLTEGESWTFEESQNAPGSERVRLYVPDDLEYDVDVNLARLEAPLAIAPVVQDYGRHPATAWWNAQTLTSPFIGSDALQLPSGAVVTVEIVGSFLIRDTATVPGFYGMTLNPYTTDVGNGLLWQYLNDTVMECGVYVTTAPSTASYTCTYRDITLGTASSGSLVSLYFEVLPIAPSPSTHRIPGQYDFTAPGTHDGTGSSPGSANVGARSEIRVWVQQ